MALDLHTLGQAAGLALLMEGVVYFLFADRMPATLRQLAALPPRWLRILGGGAMLLGLALVFLFKHS
ncbi:DUF2065 domain-containing protein [Megalodesulfovibrio gigas]|uniref:DUF2065 domain-containing protein n=1 Tax=Megalodesulfovibrio gigas (strain ATCC 19364 / DSM 1382 / NCIMB 9332 / VKM B-1759) TaxID=1121448 RepID=T2GAU6_MEGG1|nr:DUF2065 domain-containing protein [Megalodesulfovibrio gigas]AGW13246.1 putative Protein of unknown function DUF2065 [Megalodesulfovibrio gigas DSM 1382 = ATCC 19364]